MCLSWLFDKLIATKVSATQEFNQFFYFVILYYDYYLKLYYNIIILSFKRILCKKNI